MGNDLGSMTETAILKLKSMADTAKIVISDILSYSRSSHSVYSLFSSLPDDFDIILMSTGKYTFPPSKGLAGIVDHIRRAESMLDSESDVLYEQRRDKFVRNFMDAYNANMRVYDSFKDSRKI